MIALPIASAFSLSATWATLKNKTAGERGSGANYDTRTRQLLNSCSGWRKSENETKTIGDAALVPVNEPLPNSWPNFIGVTALPVTGYILRGSRKGSLLSLDNLLGRVVSPTLRAAVIEWHSYYSLRRGCGTMATEVMRD